MRNFFTSLALVAFFFLCAAGVIGLGVGGRYLTMKINAWLSPQEQNVKREVFEQTKSYNEGMEQQLIKYRLEHSKAADPTEKAAIESAVRHAYGDYDESKLAPELMGFVKQCKYGG